MVTLDFALLGANGDTIRLDGSVDFYLTKGFTGLGIPSTDLKLTPSAGDGSTWRSTRRGIRELDLPIVVVGSDRSDVESKLRRLASAMSDRYGTPKLLALYSDGASYEIEVHYAGGAETTFGSEAGSTFANWNIALQAPDPYWTSQQSVLFSLGASSGTKGLLPELDRMLVQTSQLLGSFSVENPGDVDAFPVWTFEGTSTGISVTLKGVGFSYTETLGTTGKVIVNTKDATVKDASNVNKYAYLGSAPKLFSIPPGSSTMSITATGSDTTTRISGYFNPRREVLH
jgi:phage-related protein